MTRSSTRSVVWRALRAAGWRFISVFRFPISHKSAAISQSQRFSDAASEISETRAQQESDWIRRAQKGDLDAFDALVALHQNRIFNLCKWNLGDDEDAADAAQDVFVRAWKAIARFRGDCALSTWLHRIAINVISDTANKRRRAPTPLSSLTFANKTQSSTRTEESELETPDLSADADPQDAAARHEKRRAVQNALAALPRNQRAVVVLFDVQGHSYEDVAAILELPIGTVKSRLSRARLALRAQLEICRELWDV